MIITINDNIIPYPHRRNMGGGQEEASAPPDILLRGQ